jgi:hypothetical protein
MDLPVIKADNLIPEPYRWRKKASRSVPPRGKATGPTDFYRRKNGAKTVAKMLKIKMFAISAQ